MGSWWLVVLAGFLVLAGYRFVRARRSRDHARNFLVMYRDPRYPIVIRNSIASAPILAASIAVPVAGLLVSRVAAQWLTVPAVVVAELAMILSYRVPAPFLPRWMREDLEAGRLEVARPDDGDRVLLTGFTVAVVIWVVAAPALILAGRFPT